MIIDSDVEYDSEVYSEDVTESIGRYAHDPRLGYTQPPFRQTVDGEWLRTYGKRAEMPLHAPGVRIVEFWRQQAGPGPLIY
jgi:hypothetical protein